MTFRNVIYKNISLRGSSIDDIDSVYKMHDG